MKLLLGPRSLLTLLLLWTALAANAKAQSSLELFEQVWTLVEQKFYREDLAGLDSSTIRKQAEIALKQSRSKEESVAIINGFLARLGASHTRLFSDREPDYYELLDLFAESPQSDQIKRRFGGDSPHYEGILLHERQGKVVDVVPGGPAERAGILPGDRIIKVDQRPYHPMDSFVQRAGQTLDVQVSRGDSTLVLKAKPEVIYPRQAFLRSYQESVSIKRMEPYDIGYIRTWSFAGTPYHEMLEKLLAEELAKADGLLLDLRGRWGGAQPDYLSTFGLTPTLELIRRGEQPSQMSGSLWDKPVAMLIDDSVSSGKELLVYGFKKAGRGPVCGSRTQGSVLGGSLHLLPDGHALYLAVVDVVVDGERLEGIGVAPDYEIERSKSRLAAEKILWIDIFKKDLDRRVNRDQAVRERPDHPLMATVDQENDLWAKTIVQVVGWPLQSQIGQKGSSQFWLLVQHSQDLAFQKLCLDAMEQAVSKQEASPADFAYLLDRVQMREGKKQTYGTQLKVVSGKTELWPIAEPEKVNERRKSMGLPPLADP